MVSKVCSQSERADQVGVWVVDIGVFCCGFVLFCLVFLLILFGLFLVCVFLFVFPFRIQKNFDKLNKLLGNGRRQFNRNKCKVLPRGSR